MAVLTGAGDQFFSVGWDLKAAAAGESVDADHGHGGFKGLTEFFGRAKPVVAAVNGLALGGGFELALASDLIVAADHAEFALPEVRRGVVADSGGSGVAHGADTADLLAEVGYLPERIEELRFGGAVFG